LAASVALLLASTAAHAQWVGLGAGGSGSDFSNTANWNNGNINGDFTSLSSSASLTVSASKDFGTASNPNASFTFNFNTGAAAGGLSLVIGDGVSPATTLGITGNITLSPRTTVANTVTFASNVTLKLNSRFTWQQSSSGTGQSPVVIINGPVDLQTFRFQQAAGALTINGVVSSTGATPANIATANLVYGAGGDAAGMTLTNPNNSFLQNIGAGGFSSLTANSTVPIADAGANSALGAGSSLAMNNSTISLLGFSTAISSNRSFSVANTGTLRNNASSSSGTLNLTGNASAGSGNTFQLGGSNTGDNIFAGIYSGTGANLNKSDGGNWTISNPSNTFTGSVSAQGGELRFTSIANYGVVSSLGTGGTSSNIQVNNGNLVFTGTTAQSSNRNFALVNNGNLANNATDPTATLNLSGNATIAASNWNFNLNGSNTGDNIISGVISGPGNLSKNDGGTWTVSNSNSSFTGNVTINSGQLKFTSVSDYGTNSALGTGGASSVILVNNGSLVFVGSSAQSTNRSIVAVNTGSIINNASSDAAVLTLAGPVTINSPNWTLSLGGSNPGSNALSSSVTGLISGPGKLFKGGSGTWLVSNDANNFTGEVNVGSGTLRFTSIGNVGVPSSLGTGTADNYIVLNNGALSFVGTAPQSTNRPFYVYNTGDLVNDAASASSTLTITDFSYFYFAGGGGTLRLGGSNTGDNTIAAAIFSSSPGAGGLNKIGNGKWILTSPYNNFGSPSIGGGTIEVPTLENQGGPGPIGVGTDINLNNGTLSVASSTAQSSNRTFNLNQGGAVAANGNAPAASLTLTGTIKAEGNSGTITFTGSNTGANTIAGTLQDGGKSLGVAKAGAGTWSFTGNASYSGGTSVTGGEYRVANSGNGSAFGAGGVSVGSGARLTIDRADDLTVGNSISGAGNLVKANSNTLTLTGNNTLSGTITVGSGTLQVANTGSAGALGTAAISLASGTTLDLARADAYTVPGAISGAGSVKVSAPGAATLSGNLSYTGDTTVLAGASLTVQKPLRPVTGSLVVTGQGASVTLAQPGSPSGYTVSGEFASITVGGNGQAANSTLTLDPNDRTVNKAHVLITSALTIGDSGFIDLGYNDMIIRGGASSLATIRSYVANWYNTGSNGLGSNYANPFGADYTTIAVFANSAGGGNAYFTTYDGVALTANDVIVKMTYVGDTNLDGVLDGRDVKRVFEGFITGQSGWEWGDVDYSGGAITAADVAAFNTAYSYFTGHTLGSLGDGTGVAEASSAIPEPSAAMALSVPVLMGATRRRRRNG
jgi:fibronectin-binding autotransporter adhesin